MSCAPRRAFSGIAIETRAACAGIHWAGGLFERTMYLTNLKLLQGLELQLMAINPAWALTYAGFSVLAWPGC